MPPTSTLNARGGKDVLSPAERLRMAEVNKALAEGKNPYYHEGQTNTGGSLQEPRERVIRDRSEAEVARLEAFWRSGAGTKTFKPQFDPDDPILKDLNDDSAPLPPDQIACSFCQKVFSSIRATEGKGKVTITTVQDVLIRNGEIVMEDRIKRSVEHQVACPDCSTRVVAKFGPIKD
jgi:hypothetical protein